MKDVTIVVGTVGQSIMRSEDNGNTWARIGPKRGFAYEASVRCIAMHPKEPNILFAGTGTPTPAMLFRSKDGGQTWEKRPVEVAAECEAVGTPRFTGIAVDPVEPNHIWAGL